MNDWKYLKDGVPLDWWTNNDYEIQCYKLENSKKGESSWLPTINNRLCERQTVIEHQISGMKYRYRKSQPMPPTHEEIMTKWWKDK